MKLLLTLLSFYFLFIYWYYFHNTGPIQPEEIESLKKDFKHWHDTGIWQHVAQLAENDNGKEIFFFLRNKLHKEAKYEVGHPLYNKGISGVEAYQKHYVPCAMLSLFKGASHAIFVGEPILDHIKEKTDKTMMLRFRSVRDLIQIVSSDYYQECVKHRLAGQKELVMIPVPFVYIPSPVYVVTILFMAIYMWCGRGGQNSKLKHE